MSEPPVPRPGQRASDADRESSAQRLREAAADGRITLGELGERLDRAYAAKTYADLGEVTSDLPGPAADGGHPPAVGSGQGAAVRSQDPAARSPGLFGRVSVALMSGIRRRGQWAVSRHHAALACMGGIIVDLREASFPGPEVTVHAYAVMGGITVIVPRDAAVDVAVLPLMGAVSGRAAGPGAPGAPRVRVIGVACMGGVSVKRRDLRAALPAGSHDSMRA